MTSKYKRPGYVAAYKRLRFAQDEQNNRNHAWIWKGFLYLFVSLGPVLFFQAFSIITNLYFNK